MSKIATILAALFLLLGAIAATPTPAAAYWHHGHLLALASRSAGAGAATRTLIITAALITRRRPAAGRATESGATATGSCGAPGAVINRYGNYAMTRGRNPCVVIAATSTL